MPGSEKARQRRSQGLASVKAIEVRLAQNEDGDDIHGLVLASGFEIPGLDWHDIYPHWLVAEMDGNLVGCIQVCLGKPIAYLEYFSFDQGLSHQSLARVLKALTHQGFIVLKNYGSQMAVCFVSFENKAFKRILKKRGGSVMQSGNLIGRRLV